MAHTRDIIDFVEFFQEILPKSLIMEKSKELDPCEDSEKNTADTEANIEETEAAQRALVSCGDPEGNTAEIGAKIGEKETI